MIFRFFALSTLIMTVLLNIYVLIRSYLMGEIAASNRDRVIEVTDSQGNFAGLIVGSFHANISTEELQPTKDLFANFIDSLDLILIECEPAHWTQMSMGTERVLLEMIEQQGMRDKLICLECLSDQRHFLSSWYPIGSKTYAYPTAFFPKNTPFLLTWLNWVNQLCWSMINTIYSAVTGSSDAVAQQKIDTVALMRKNYLEGKTGTASTELLDMAQVLSRDKASFEKFEQLHQSGQTFLYVVGMAHVSADQGILSHFENAGYTLKPYQP